MAHKLFGLGFIFCGVVGAYIIMAAAMPSINEIVTTANTSLVASANMSNFPGTQEAVLAFPLYVWFIPVLVGLVVSVVFLKEEIIRRVRR